MLAPVLDAVRDQLRKQDERKAARLGSRVPVAHVAAAPGVRTLGDMLRTRALRSGSTDRKSVV